jgi:large subunit ribosomal protein L13
MTHTIDATNKKLGRLASQVAVILQGKNSAKYNPNKEGEDKVVVTNLMALDVAGSKFDEKTYYRHAGALGHLNEKKFRDVFARNPTFVLRRAVRLMLPKNRLAAKRLRRLTIEK